MRRRSLLLTVCAVLGFVGAFAATARADGDPASDYLVGTKVFFPFDAKFPAEQKAQFAGLVTAANQQGFKIRVALIAGSYDLGSITSLWMKPRTYARFLGQELAFIYKQRLLVVMPNGYGFNWAGHPSKREYAVLAKIPPPKTTANFLSSAQLAVERLAAASGIKIKPPTQIAKASQRNNNDRIVLIAVIAAALALAVAARYGLRRLRR